MATAFSFPASPVTGQLVSLPDGNQAQWNGYAWVEFGASGITTYITDATPPSPKYGDRWIRPASMTEVVWVPNAGTAGVWVDLMDAGSVAYPIPIAKGGTGATTAAQARINLGISSATGEFIIPTDGTSALPGLAWATQPDLGWMRDGASTVHMTANGRRMFSFGFSNPGSYLSLYASAANNITQMAFVNQTNGTADYNYLGLRQNTDNTAQIFTGIAGAAVRGNLIIDAPQTLVYQSGTVALPSLAFGQEPGLGWYRPAASQIGVAAQGQRVMLLSTNDPAATSLNLNSRAVGAIAVTLVNGPSSSTNYNVFTVTQAAAGGAYLTTAAGGSAVRGNLTLDAPQVLFNNGSLAAPSIAFSQEPGMGMYRLSAGKISWAAGGAGRFVWDWSSPSATYMQATVASAAPGVISFAMANASSVNYNNFVIQLASNNGVSIGNYGGGTNVAGPINYDASSHIFNNIVVAPRFSFPGGLTSWSSDANAVYFQFATGYYWQWANANGALTWVHNGKSTVFSPTGELFVSSNIWAGSTQDFGLICSDTTQSILRFANAGWGLFYRKTDGALFYRSATGTNLHTIDGGGNVTSYSGTASRAGPAMWQDGGNGAYLSMSGTAPGASTIWAWQYNKTTGDLVWLDYASTANFMIYGGGGGISVPKGTATKPAGGMWGDSSDARIKEHIENYTTGLDAVLGLRPVTYNFIEETGRDTSIRYTGLIAQEAEVPMPELVTTKEGAVGRVACDDLRTMDTTPLIYAFINAIKTLDARLKAAGL